MEKFNESLLDDLTLDLVIYLLEKAVFQKENRMSLYSFSKVKSALEDKDKRLALLSSLEKEESEEAEKLIQRITRHFQDDLGGETLLAA